VRLVGVKEEKPVWIKIRKTEDLCRLAASIVTMGQPMYLVRIRRNNEVYIGLLAVYRDYFKYYGIPIFYYTLCEGLCTEKKYVSFKIDESGEKIEFTDKAIPGTVMIPIVEFETMPSILGEWKGE
jgi:hypothetical protein